MTAIAVTAAKVAPVWPQKSEIHSFQALETITAGQAVYQTTAGKVGLADADGAAGVRQFRGIALTGGGAGQAVDVLIEGAVYGFTITGLAYDDPVYLGEEAGGLDEVLSSTLTVICGRVMPMNDTGTLTKVLYVTADWLRAWA